MTSKTAAMDYNSDSDSDYNPNAPPKPSEKRFLVEVNGRFVIKPNTAEGEDEPEVMLGEIQNAATFTLADEYLWCNDWVMGRPAFEPAIPTALPICWRKWPKRTQTVKLLESNGSTVIESNGALTYSHKFSKIIIPLLSGRQFAFDPRPKVLVSGEFWMIERRSHEPQRLEV
jgi:hypothetical protein